MRRNIGLFFLLVFFFGILSGALIVSYIMNYMGFVENADTLRIENLASYEQLVKVATREKEYIIRLDKKEIIQVKANFKGKLEVFLLSLDYEFELGEKTEYLILEVDFLENKINRINREEKHIKVDFTQK